MITTNQIAPFLPHLRRYARALTGSQKVGDAHLRETLRAILNEEQQLSEDLPAKVALFRLFHSTWFNTIGPSGNETGPLRSVRPAVRRSLPLSISRCALLLTTGEGFSIETAAQILAENPELIERAIAEGKEALEGKLYCEVLIIEDEQITAMHLTDLVNDLGYGVIGVAASKTQAVAMALEKKPGLILVDINLGEGGSGVEAINEIMKTIHVPIIFITAYPEKLLSGDLPDATYLISKPFLPQTVYSTIREALYFSMIEEIH